MNEKNKKVLMPRSLPAFLYFLDLLLLCGGKLSLWNMVRGRGCCESGQNRQVFSALLDKDMGPASQEGGLEALENPTCGWLIIPPGATVLVNVSKLADS